MTSAELVSKHETLVDFFQSQKFAAQPTPQMIIVRTHGADVIDARSQQENDMLQFGPQRFFFAEEDYPFQQNHYVIFSVETGKAYTVHDVCAKGQTSDFLPDDAVRLFSGMKKHDGSFNLRKCIFIETLYGRCLRFDIDCQMEARDFTSQEQRAVERYLNPKRPASAGIWQALAQKWKRRCNNDCSR